MNRNLAKAQRRRLRELGGIAYERDLSNELAKVESAFRAWRAGELDPFELSETIHRFHQGPARALFTRYDDSNVECAVASAIHRGVLSREEAGADIVEMFDSRLACLREMDAQESAGSGVAEPDRPLRAARSPERS